MVRTTHGHKGIHMSLIPYFTGINGVHLPLNNVVSVTSADKPEPAEFTADTEMVYVVFGVSPLIVVDVIVAVVVLVVPPETITL